MDAPLLASPSPSPSSVSSSSAGEPAASPANSPIPSSPSSPSIPSSPSSPPRFALGLVGLIAALKLALHLATTGHFGYGYFTDELYYLACSRHLAWGFVDLPPLFPAITALQTALLGSSLFALRLLPALSGAALVLMTALIARDLGGRRFAQGIAALAVLTAPIWLLMHSIDTMNELDQLFWTACAWIVLRILRDEPDEREGRDGRPRLWLAFGAVAGLGMLNKHSMAFYGVALLAGLLLTRERRVFLSPWFWLGGAVAGLLFLPNLLWLVQHHFPHFEVLANIKREGRDVHLGPLQFLAQQVQILNPLALPLWLGGLVWLLAARQGRRYRPLGLAFLAVLAEMLLLDGRPYYPAPAYPLLLAAGGVALEAWLNAGAAIGAAAARRDRLSRFLAPGYAVALALSGALLAPLVVPIFPPLTTVRYSRAIGLAQPAIENHRTGPLPQLMADRFGWPEMVAEVARVYRTLPPADRAKAAIFGQNYGQAGAIDLFGPALGLPPALSGHLSYFLWGPRGYTGEVMIVLDDDPATLSRLFRDVRLAGHVDHPLSMPYQHFDVFVCRGPRLDLATAWPRLKRYA